MHGFIGIGVRRIGLGLVAACMLGLSGPASAQALQRKVQAALTEARLGSSVVGLSVVDLGTSKSPTSRDLAAINDNASMIPASNLKLLTSGAALLTLGADHQFQTRLIRDGDRLVVIGCGDPGFADPELLDEMRLSVEQFVDRLAATVKASGMAAVREVVVDDRVFDRGYVHPEWPSDQLNRWYCAEVSGLNFHANVLRVFASPAEKADRPARIRTEPSVPWLDIAVRARTIREGTTAFWAERDPKTGQITVHGSVKSAPDEPVEVTVHEGSAIFAHMLADRLAKAGLGSPTSRLAQPGERLGDQGGGSAVGVVSTPMSVVLRRCNGDSHNLYAESLLKAVGHAATGQPGSWSSGASVVRTHVRDLVDSSAAAGLVMTDGSGLSRSNRVSPGTLTHWIGALASRGGGVAEAFVGSLPVAGEDGTLKKRFQGKSLDNEVRAKTGFINGVRCLSGYVTHVPTGRRVAFSVMVNEIPGAVGGPKVKEFHEKVVLIADDWLTQQVGAAASGEALGGRE